MKIKEIEVIEGKFQTIEEKLEIIRTKINEVIKIINKEND